MDSKQIKARSLQFSPKNTLVVKNILLTLTVQRIFNELFPEEIALS